MENISNELQTICSERMWRSINREIKQHVEEVHTSTKTKHNVKLGKLKMKETRQTNGQNTDESGWVVNRGFHKLLGNFLATHHHHHQHFI